LFRIFLLGRILPSAFLFSSNVFPNDSFEFLISCLDVLLISVDLILPIVSRVDLGLKVYGSVFFSLSIFMSFL